MDNQYKLCSLCKTEKLKSEYFLKSKKRGTLQSKCKACCAIYYRERRNHKEFKKKCVEYKGGKCEKCGYNKCFAVLDFHHIDPNNKKFGLAKITRVKLNDNIKKELDKCIILCKNCHYELHYCDVDTL